MNITSLYDTEFNSNLFENNVERTLSCNEKNKSLCGGKCIFYLIYLFIFCQVIKIKRGLGHFYIFLKRKVKDDPFRTFELGEMKKKTRFYIFNKIFYSILKKHINPVIQKLMFCFV